MDAAACWNAYQPPLNAGFNTKLKPIDPLMQLVASLPVELQDLTRPVGRPIEAENGTTHVARTLNEFTELKRRERLGILGPNGAEYIRYGTVQSNLAEAAIVAEEGGAAACIFKSARAAIICTLEALC